MATLSLDLEQCRRSLRAIEHVFGESWLRRSAAKPAGSHPVPYLWAEARSTIERASLPDTQIPPPVIEFFEVGWLFDVAMRLPGFAAALTPRNLKIPEQWSSSAYTAKVAALGVQAGYDVRFIPEEKGKRRPDLLMTGHGVTLEAECKRLGDYIRREPLPHPDGFHSMGEILSLTRPGHSIELLAVDRLRPGLISSVKERAEVLHRDGRVILDDCLVRVAPLQGPLPTISLGLADGTWTTPSQDPADHVAASLVTLDGPSVRKIKEAFRQAKGQVGENAAGLLFVDIDTALLAGDQVRDYMEVLAAWVRRQFRPDSGRYAAIAVTGTVERRDTRPEDGALRTLARGIVVRNPHVPGSEQLVVPGFG